MTKTAVRAQIEAIRAAPSRLNEVDRLIHFSVTNHFVDVYRRTNDKITADWQYWGDHVLPML